MNKNLSSDQFITTDTIFPRYQRKGYPEPTKDEYVEQDIPTDRLVAINRVVYADDRSTSSGPISVTQQGGWYFVGDGHHRAARAIKAGEKTISARIYKSD